MHAQRVINTVVQASVFDDFESCSQLLRSLDLASERAAVLKRALRQLRKSLREEAERKGLDVAAIESPVVAKHAGSWIPFDKTGAASIPVD